MAGSGQGSIFDRAYEAVLRLVSPRAASLRAHHRQMAEGGDYAAAFHIAARMRGYASAKQSAGKTPWLHSSDRNADGEIVPSHPTLRNNSRALQRDNSLGSGIVATLKRGTVGTGLRPQARTGDKVKDDALELVGADLLSRVDRANALDHAGHQALVYQGTAEAGDILLRAVADGPGEPVWIEVVESERISTPTDARPKDPAGRIVSGVEKDGRGRPVAYWVAKRHPGDSILQNTVLGSAAVTRPSLTVADYDRVEVGPGVAFVRSRVTRPGQSRGVPIFHACLQDLHDLELLILASLKRSQIAACLAMFIKTGADAADLLDLTAEDYGYQLDATIQPGGIFRLFPGEEAQFSTPPATSVDLSAFVFLLAQRIGAAVGLSPEAVLRAWKGVSYSGARTIKIDDRQTYRSERASFASQVLAWEWRVVLEDALMRGDPRLLAAGVTLTDVGLVDWIGDEEQWVDPQAEATAIETMLRLKLTAPQIECARLGRDYEDVLRQCIEAEATEKKIRAELGVPAQVAAPGLKVLPGGKSDDDAEAEAA
jgi:lambda family phage portal protein